MSNVLSADAYLYVGGDGATRFPYRNEKGEVDTGLLRTAMADIRSDIMLPKHVRGRLMRRATRIFQSLMQGKSGGAIGYLEYKTVASGPEVEVVANDGIVEAYVGAFGNVDGGDDILYKGAAADTIAEKFTNAERAQIIPLYGHDEGRVVGKALEIREDGKGIYTKTKYNLNTFWGNEAYQLVAAGDIWGHSMGYLPGEDTKETKAVSYDDQGLRHLHRIELFEYGPLPFPMNNLAHAIGVKSGLNHQGSFSALVAQAANAVEDVLVEAEALASRRIGRQIKAEHIDAMLELKETARAAIERVEQFAQAESDSAARAGEGEPESSVQGTGKNEADAFHLAIDMARARLRAAGILEV